MCKHTTFQIYLLWYEALALSIQCGIEIFPNWIEVTHRCKHTLLGYILVQFLHTVIVS